MSKLITGDNERIVQFYQRLKETLIALESALKEKRPLLNGQRYMTDAELSQYLKLSRRNLTGVQEQWTCALLSDRRQDSVPGIRYRGASGKKQTRSF